MSAFSDFQSKMTAAVSAQESGDYTAALMYLRSAKMLLATIPDSAGGKSSTQWRDELTSMIEDLKGLQASQASASTGDSIRRTKIRYKNVDAEDEC